MSFTNKSQPKNSQKSTSEQLGQKIYILASLINEGADSHAEIQAQSKEALKLLETLLASPLESQVIKQKLSNDLNVVLKRYKQKQQERKVVVKQELRREYKQEEEQPLLLAYDPNLQGEIELNEHLIQERDFELVGLETSIAEVNEIFRDLGTLVNEQQYLLDNIENNVGSVVIDMENATGELNQASRYQSSRGKCMWYVFLVLLVITSIMVLIIRPWRW